MRTRVGFIAGFTAAFIAAALLSPEAAPPVRGASNVQQPGGYVGSEDCAACHEASVESHRRSVHSQIDSGDWPVSGCESCHGPAEAHIATGGETPMRFDPRSEMTVKDSVAVCTDCHSGSSTFNFRSADHMKGTVACTDCHETHAGAGVDLLLVDSTQEACLGCHAEVRGQGQLTSRHRLEDRMVACTDCHVQHDPGRRAHLGGFKQETCTGCHTDKEGPFVFEHAAGRVEGCTACHDPHGSTNRHMLTYQNQGDLCYSCHTLVPGFHAPPRFVSDTNCTNCHTQIHGSNLHPAYLQ